MLVARFKMESIIFSRFIDCLLYTSQSPNNAERDDIGYSSAWLHHKGRNRHHYEYWIDYSTRGIKGGMAPVAMPRKYVVEMLMDRIAASKTYRGSAYTDQDPLDYYKSAKEPPMLHPKTKAQLEKLLTMLAEEGEEKTFAYVRSVVLKKGRRKAGTKQGKGA